MEAMKEMKAETDPIKNVSRMQEIIKTNHLDNTKDAEIIDALKFNVANAFLNAGNHAEFEKYISLMSNQFNQTSYLSSAVYDLIQSNKDLPYAEKLARQILDKYNSFKNDPTARPESISKEDWKRFMDFAYYPYNDTYAAALYANGKYKEALKYQSAAFPESPDDGIPSSIERFAHLLELNNQSDSAYQLLLKRAKSGNSTAAMDKQLKRLYVKKNGNENNFDILMKEVQASVQEVLKKEFSKKALTINVPDFTLSDLNGVQVSLSDFKDKIVVIDFWATWCLPCLASFPAMLKVMENHPEVVFLFINTREEGENPTEKVKKFILSRGYPFYVLMDEPTDANNENYKVLSIFKPNGIPAKIIIDKNGQQKFMTTGFNSENELINELEAMISIASEK